MRRFAFPITVVLLFTVGCGDSGPLDSPPAATNTISASVQNDTTPASESGNTPAEATAGGILIGSGT